MMIRSLFRSAILPAFLSSAIALSAQASPFKQAPILKEQTDAGTLPPVAERLPDMPKRVSMEALGLQPGQYGGSLKMLMRKAKETRQMVVYGYARLVAFDQNLDLQPDILRDIDVEEGRIFTLHLRPGHKWSDGHPFTSEDFRFWWEDIANNSELYPVGPPASLKINGQLPKVEFLDTLTIRFTWQQPNPTFLTALAGPSPRYIYAPSHYLKQFHGDYADPEALAARVEEYSAKNWAALLNKLSKSYKNNNPDLPSLQPWVLDTGNSTNRFIFKRNAYYYKVDENGAQLPYIDEWIFNVTDKKLIPLKSATGEVDLQSRHLKFEDITLLVQNEEQYGFKTRMWRTAKGAHMALFPNLNVNDPMWQKLVRDVRFRRALSLAINRYELNRVIYFGLAIEGQNTLLPGSPLYNEAHRKAFAEFDLDAANALLDEMGLTEKDGRGIRILPNGEPLEIIVETADGGTEQPDVLQLISDSWFQAGIKLHIKPSSLEVLRRRIFSGETVMSIFSGLENGLATAAMSPEELAPVKQDQYQWPKWGQYIETGGKSGTAPDMKEAQHLFDLYGQWFVAQSNEERTAIWQRMLALHADQLYSIGLIAGTLQPVMVIDGLMNVPEEGVWNWNPGAHFGVYRPDRFWFDPLKSDASYRSEEGTHQ